MMIVGLTIAHVVKNVSVKNAELILLNAKGDVLKMLEFKAINSINLEF